MCPSSFLGGPSSRSAGGHPRERLSQWMSLLTMDISFRSTLPQTLSTTMWSTQTNNDNYNPVSAKYTNLQKIVLEQFPSDGVFAGEEEIELSRTQKKMGFAEFKILMTRAGHATRWAARWSCMRSITDLPELFTKIEMNGIRHLCNVELPIHLYMRPFHSCRNSEVHDSRRNCLVHVSAKRTSVVLAT